jgi:hypothetical protein
MKFHRIQQIATGVGTKMNMVVVGMNGRYFVKR